MGGFSLIHWIIVLAVVILVFGARRVSDIGKGLGEGIRNFKKGVQGDEDEAGLLKAGKRQEAGSDEDSTVDPKQLASGKKKVIHIEIGEDEDEAEVLKKLAVQKAARKKASESEGEA